jgi:uncharacterized protein YjaG (DUF416 family)
MFNLFKKKEVEIPTQTTFTAYVKMNAAEAKQLSDIKHSTVVKQMAECWVEKSYIKICAAAEKGLYSVEVQCPIAKDLTMDDLAMMKDIADEFERRMDELGYETEFNSTLYTVAHINWKGGGQ